MPIKSKTKANPLWSKPRDIETVNKVILALKNNEIEALYFETENDAKSKVLELIPNGAEVMTMTSVTLDKLGISNEINNSEKFSSVRNKLNDMNKSISASEKQKLGAAPDYVIGSVHAVTEDGQLLIASATGSQLPAYAYGSQKVIFVVGTQKIVKNLDEAMDRIYNYTLPLESERAKIAYGVVGSAVNKILLIKKEYQPERIKVIFIGKVIGF